MRTVKGVPPICRNCPHYVESICGDAAKSRPLVCSDCMEPPATEEQFGAMFERHHRHVIAWACRFTGSYELARDLAQEVFIKAWSALGRFRGGSRFTTWLFAITRNCCLDYMKARAARPREVDSRALDTAPPVVHNDALASLEAQHAARLVRRLMRDARLDPIEARAFRLHYGEDVPLEAVTARLGLTNASGARAQIVSAKRKLRRSVERWQRAMARPRASRAALYATPAAGR